MNFNELAELNRDEYEYFKGLVYEETGIKLTDLKKSLLQSRLHRRLRILKIETFDEYRKYIESNYQSEIINFINVITTNKTEFFREEHHFDFLKDTVFPDLRMKRKNRIRIWSAGCSTGEEPYSIAITINEIYDNKCSNDVKILATDIDTQVLEKGKQGIYSGEIVKEIDINLLKRYFYKGKDQNEGAFKVKENVRDLVVFRRLNLLDFNYPMKGRFDVIFCRNVVIYFDKETQRRLFENFYNYLDDDGYLIVGHSENLSSITDKFRHLGKTIYKKVR